ncbi:MAG: ATP-dependent dethiobiotin synthetase BioD [Cyanobacteria bacterium SID2]|nr:ATP-dependent dethiobiotin synthetase BioD [Cyanobacteria bacterium SID2]MBP0005547.1 ATP-dependent dethiobiotin synthetase BioD [Cyanobacteria bacterium SBC]
MTEIRSGDASLAQTNVLFIAGTDTDAGKTVLTAALIAYWQKYHHDRRLGLMKPLQSGTGDREFYTELFDLDQTPESITPQYFQAPLAPPLAAEKEGRSIDLGLVWREFTQLKQQRDFLFVESLGGLGSPVTRELTVADLARDWQLPTVLVVPVKLGAISHTVANVALARQMKVNLVGIVLNCIQPRTDEDIANWTPADLIESLTQVSVLGCLPYLENLKDTEKLAAIAASLDLEQLF